MDFLQNAFNLLGYSDSNQEKQDQNLLCYHYTIAQNHVINRCYDFDAAKVQLFSNIARILKFFFKKIQKKERIKCQSFVMYRKPSIFAACSLYINREETIKNKFLKQNKGQNVMNETKLLVQKITEGIQEKKGKNIVIADLTNIGDTICKYFIICQGNSSSQVLAIADSVKEYVKKTTGERVYGMDGVRNAQWIAMDYGDILVHVFLPEVRSFYNLENLWADAKLTTIPDLD